MKSREIRSLLAVYYLRNEVRFNNQRSVPAHLCSWTNPISQCYAKVNNRLFLKLLQRTKWHFTAEKSALLRHVPLRKVLVVEAQSAIFSATAHLNAVSDTDFTLKPSNLCGRSVSPLILGRNPEHYSRSWSVINVSIWKLGSCHYTRCLKPTVYSHKY